MTNQNFRLLILVIFFIVGCKASTKKVTSVEVNTFISQLQSDANKRRKDFLTARLILPIFQDRVTQNAKIKGGSLFAKRMAEIIKQGDIEKELFRMLGSDGSFEKVNIYEKDGSQHIIFRAYGEELNYYDVELAKYKGKVGIADVLGFATGEQISKTMGEFTDKLTHEMLGNDFRIINSKMKAVKTNFRNGQYQEAKDEFERLPGHLQTVKSNEILYLEILSALKDKDYINESESFEKKYKDDPYVHINMIDLYVMNEDYENALYSIDQVDSLAHHDTFLDYARAIVVSMKKDTSGMIAYLKNVAENNPEFPGSHILLCSHYLETGEKEKARQYFEQYKKLKGSKKEYITYYKEHYPFLSKEN